MKRIVFIISMATLMVVLKSEKPFRAVSEMEEASAVAEMNISEASSNSLVYQNCNINIYGDMYVLPNVENEYTVTLKSSTYENVKVEASPYNPLATDPILYERPTTYGPIYVFSCDDIGAYYFRVFATNKYNGHKEEIGYFTIIAVGAL